MTVGGGAGYLSRERHATKREIHRSVRLQLLEPREDQALFDAFLHKIFFHIKPPSYVLVNTVYFSTFILAYIFVFYKKYQEKNIFFAKPLTFFGYLL
jgi:hypothetical protein